MVWLFYLSQAILMGLLDWVFNPNLELLIILFLTNYVMAIVYYYFFVRED